MFFLEIWKKRKIRILEHCLCGLDVGTGVSRLVRLQLNFHHGYVTRRHPRLSNIISRRH